MKELHLPYNIGSKILITVNAQREIGIDAKGIAINNYLDEEGKNLIIVNPAAYSYFHPKKYFKIAQAYYELFRLIHWADIIHWYYDYPVLKSGFILKWVKFLKKPAVVEWLGSEVRIPEILSLHNPVYKNSFSNEYSLCDTDVASLYDKFVWS